MNLFEFMNNSPVTTCIIAFFVMVTLVEMAYAFAHRNGNKKVRKNAVTKKVP